MDIFAYLLLQIINGFDWKPKFSISAKFKNWIAHLDLKTCPDCRRMHGKIWIVENKPEKEPPLHPNCRCSIIPMKTIKSGTATTKCVDGADWQIKYNKKLPDYYISYEDALKIGWNPKIGNLSSICPKQMITRGEYINRNNHLPNKEGHIWYEADINYKSGYRNKQRVVYSNDGLIFVSFDHYKTFFEII